MADGMASAVADGWLNALFNNTSYSVATVFIKLHTGAPGAAGASNAATETTRKSVSMGTSSAGVIANDVAITWTSIAGSQDATDFSLWDASTAGNFLGSGTITANPYTAGDTYNIAIGALTITLVIAS